MDVKKLFYLLCAWVIFTTLNTNVVSASDFASSKKKVMENILDNKVSISHRVASGYAPKHTFYAYDKYHKEFNAYYIKLDLQLTNDGNLIASHDEDVEHTTGHKGRVEDYNTQEPKQMDVGSWFNKKYPKYAKKEYKGAKIPTLEDILDR